MKRPLHPREIVLRVFHKHAAKHDAQVSENEVHVYRIGLASGAAIPACTRGEQLLNMGAGYWQYAAHSWLIEKAPICETCYQALVTEGLAKEKSPVTVTRGLE